MKIIPHLVNEITFAHMKRVLCMSAICFCFRMIAQPDTDSLLMSTDTIFFSENSTLVDSVLLCAQKFIGTPYKYGSASAETFDCSGFVCHAFGSCGVELPHGSGSQAMLSEKIDLKNVQPGDLMFFKGSSIRNSRIGHVALVMEVNDGVIKIIHATHRGVVVDVYNESEYYKKRFIKAGRLKLEN